VVDGAWHNSETAGSMIDRLSIVSLKILHMRAQTARGDAPAAHVALCREKLALLEAQRADLGRCLATLLLSAARGTVLSIPRFKMYNDPALNHRQALAPTPMRAEPGTPWPAMYRL
jgi:hypothetical protein